jgi:hypothetical protein
MKKSLFAAAVAALFATAAVFGASTDSKEVTVVGNGQCAKCALHQTDSCQNTVTVSENGKTEVYYLTQNEVSDDFHDQICKKAQKIKVTGTVKEADGKKEITPSKIEVVKG